MYVKLSSLKRSLDYFSLRAQGTHLDSNRSQEVLGRHLSKALGQIWPLGQGLRYLLAAESHGGRVAILL